MGGALYPGVHILHGGPGVGKTAFALQTASTCQCPALYVSAEMGTLELFRRVVARETSTFLGRLKSGELTPDESIALAKRTAERMPMLAIADATTAPASPAWIIQAANAVRGVAQHVLVVVDSVHSWSEALPSIRGEISEYDRLNDAILWLRMVAKATNGPVLGVAERNRASMSKGGLSASAGSRKFEYAAESLFDLNAEQDGVENAAGDRTIFLHVAKNRNGSPGRKIPLQFNGALQQFREGSR